MVWGVEYSWCGREWRERHIISWHLPGTLLHTMQQRRTRKTQCRCWWVTYKLLSSRWVCILLICFESSNQLFKYLEHNLNSPQSFRCTNMKRRLEFLMTLNPWMHLGYWNTWVWQWDMLVISFSSLLTLSQYWNISPWRWVGHAFEIRFLELVVCTVQMFFSSSAYDGEKKWNIP